MEHLNYKVEDGQQDIRIDVYLSNIMDELSRSHIQKLIKDDLVRVNNKSIKRNYKTKLDDEVQVTIPDLELVDIIAEDIPIEVVYEDDDLAIVNKPQGMVVHPSPGHNSGTLVNALMYRFADSLSGINGVKRPGIVHRIDKNTSGLLIICKNDLAHQSIAEQLKEHSITRKYNAVVYNNIKEDSGVVDEPIGRHNINRKKMAINYKNGKNAVTHFKVLERYGKYTLIEAQLETGRTHQIRVHLTHIGHPLLGDDVYGPKSPKKFSNLNGQMLHAKVIGFIHPSTGEYMEFESEWPTHFENVVKALRNQQV